MKYHSPPLFSVMQPHEKHWDSPTPCTWCNYWTASYLFLQQFFSRSNLPSSNVSRQLLTKFVVLLKSLLSLGSSVKSLKTSLVVCWMQPLWVKRWTRFLRLAFHTALLLAGFFLSSSYFLFLPCTLTPILFWSCKLIFFCIPSGNNQSIVNSSLPAVTSKLNILQKERILNSKVTARRLTKH